MSDSASLRRVHTVLSALAMFILTLQPLAAFGADQVAGVNQPAAAATATPQGIGAGLPLKRGEESELGTPAAALVAAGLLVVAVWVAMGLRKTRGRALPGAGPIQGPWLGRLLQPARQSGSLRVLGTASLSPQARLYVVGWEDKEYLLSASQGEVRVLDSRTPDAAGQMPDPADAGAEERR